jgi:hypothetical protein
VCVCARTNAAVKNGCTVQRRRCIVLLSCDHCQSVVGVTDAQLTSLSPCFTTCRLAAASRVQLRLRAGPHLPPQRRHRAARLHLGLSAEHLLVRSVVYVVCYLLYLAFSLLCVLCPLVRTIYIRVLSNFWSGHAVYLLCDARAVWVLMVATLQWATCFCVDFLPRLPYLRIAAVPV